ncbi:MAG: amidohydrolase family protein [Planctomycetota bacterium]|jgi:N-acetylglucosamine-6-phosphate deacetylase
MRRFARPACAAGLLAAAVLLSPNTPAPAQPVAPVDGPKPVHLERHAVTGAAVITAPGTRLENATILIEGDTILAVGDDVAVPEGFRTWDAAGHVIHAGLIEPWLEVSVPAPDPAAAGTHWNPMVKAQVSALETTGFDAALRGRMRSMGVTVAQLVPDDGILRGTAAVVTMAEDRPGDPAARVVVPASGHVASLQTARGRSGYPGSKMGAIALLRQSLADADWRRAASVAHAIDPAASPRPAADDAIDALARDLPLMMAVGDELDLLRATRTAAEFGRPVIVRGSGDEWRRLAAIAADAPPLIVPAAVADAPAVDTVSDQRRATLRDLIAWEQSPANLRRLLDAGLEVSLTTGSLPRGQQFAGNLRTIMRHGVSADEVLAAMSTTPARRLGIDDRYGAIRAGMSASFVVLDGEPFARGSEVRDVWVDGRRHEVSARPAASLAGRWTVTAGGEGVPLGGTIEIGDGPSLAWTPAAAEDAEDAVAEADGDDAEDAETARETDDADPTPVAGTRVRRLENRVHAMLAGSLFGTAQPVPVTAVIEDGRLHGDALLPGGRLVRWSADPVAEDDSDTTEEPNGDRDASPITVPDLPGLPIGAYGLTEIPRQETVAFIGATVWTSGPAGIIENGAVLLREGRIAFVGPAADLEVPEGARVIDADGMHLTPGLIDCHSHTGISGGVNEGTDAVTCEVRIADVINPDDIDWYRQVAGGITAVNQLHGSANPIGGQNSVVKLRWGSEHPDDMRLADARPGVKWALGENVKQSNWGSRGTGRYPQTRMGVEGIQHAMLLAGREYGRRIDAWNALPEAERARLAPPRRDLELEAMAAIVRGEMLIHCHSYRQDEILMLARLAGEFGFRIGTFQHVLEGYKVADAIREHAIGASAFSDWWAYKFEVIDAIPSNGAIMHDAGVNVSFNSDSDELARRMAAEAAKAVKYGGVPMTEALKFVTLNPAIQLAVDDRIGSIEVGKDADVVLWTGSPLSSLSRVERTFIDGREYFSRDLDARLREQAAAERDRIMTLVIEGRGGEASGGRGEGRGRGGPGRRGRRMVDGPELMLTSGRDHDGGWSNVRDHVHSEEELAAIRAEWTFLMRNGIEPSGARPGDCGCTIHDLLLEDH